MEASGAGGRDDPRDLGPGQIEHGVRRARVTVHRKPETDFRPAVSAVSADPSLKKLDGFVIPEGWTLEGLVRDPDHVLLSTPLPGRYMAMIDFRLRGFRYGYNTVGRLVGEEWNTKRKKYIGRGWRQEVIDDAVAHLRKVIQ